MRSLHAASSSPARSSSQADPPHAIGCPLRQYPEESREGARWVFEPTRIWWHYLMGWFALDAVSILVSVFDLLSISEASVSATQSSRANASSTTVSDESGALSAVVKLKALRVLRVLRLIKLLRLLRMSRIFKRWESKVAINYAAAALFKVFASLLLWAHLCACIWILQADLFAESRTTTWLGTDGMCSTVVDANGARVDLCHPPGEIYVAALYWAVMTSARAEPPPPRRWRCNPRPQRTRMRACAPPAEPHGDCPRALAAARPHVPGGRVRYATRAPSPRARLCACRASHVDRLWRHRRDDVGGASRCHHRHAGELSPMGPARWHPCLDHQHLQSRGDRIPPDQ